MSISFVKEIKLTVQDKLYHRIFLIIPYIAFVTKYVSKPYKTILIYKKITYPTNSLTSSFNVNVCLGAAGMFTKLSKNMT